MPRKKTIDAFRPEFEQLLLRAHAHLSTGAREFTVQFASNNVSAGIRSRTYQYFAALRESKLRPDLTALCTGLSMRCAGAALVFFRSEDSIEATQLREALGLPRGFDELDSSRGVVAHAPSGLSSNLDKLESIRERKKLQK
jgi:NAD-specific glutamate dehydrogenase